MEEISRGFIIFGIRMFYLSFGSIIGCIVGWYSMTVPSVTFFIGLVSVIIGCKLYAK